MTHKVIGHDTDSAVKTTYHYNEDRDDMVVQRTQDMGAIAQECKRELNSHESGARFGEGRRVARIPLIELEKIMKASGGNKDRQQELLIKWLNDPEKAHFRTFAGSV